MKIKTEIDDIYPYTFDSSNMKGNADIIYIPQNIEELKQAIIHNNNNNIKMSIAGAGTGITGSRVPNGGAVISTENLKKIIEYNENYVIIEPGVTLLELDKFLEQNNKFLPPNPTEINASIGGNIATNASGARTFKYGAIRDWVEALEVIFADGDSIYIERNTIFSEDGIFKFTTNNQQIYEFRAFEIGMPNIKNASGYYLKEKMDLIDLFIGSEGTLCVFAKIKLRILDKPQHTFGAIIFFDNNDKLLDFVTIIRNYSLINNKLNYKDVNDISARLIEYFDENSLNLLKSKYPILPNNTIGALWVEQEYNYQNEEAILSKWQDLISHYTNLSNETWIALNDTEHEKLREFRHELPLQVYKKLTNNSQKKVGLDTAVPTINFPTLFRYYLEEFPKLNFQNVIFGHIGNSHLHANIFCKNENEYNEAIEIYNKVINLSLQLNGTISAEHGIGKLKKQYLIQMYGIDNINKMKKIKSIFDPKLLLNNGTMFD